MVILSVLVLAVVNLTVVVLTEVILVVVIAAVLVLEKAVDFGVVEIVTVVDLFVILFVVPVAFEVTVEL